MQVKIIITTAVTPKRGKDKIIEIIKTIISFAMLRNISFNLPQTEQTLGRVTKIINIFVLMILIKSFNDLMLTSATSMNIQNF